jgi:hypothetical protein
VLATLVSSVALLAPAGAANARDTHAPGGASDNWLPCDAWVMFHWLPYDEARLYSLLGMQRSSVQAWLRDDNHHTLGQLFARRGMTIRQAAAQLIAPEVAGAPAARARMLRNHTIDTLTQGHLAQHVLFHYFHQPLVGSRAARIFGVTPAAYRKLRLRGMSPSGIGRAHGRRRGQITYRALRVLTYAAHAGIRSGQTTRPEAEAFLATQRRGLHHWLDSHIRKPGAGGDWAPKGVGHMSMLCFLLRGDTG